MNKYLVVLIVILGLVACSKKDEQFYRSNPKELQRALKICPDKQPEGLTCDQMEQLGRRMNNLAYQLQYSPQGFGQKIMVIQEAIAKQKMELKNKGANSELKESLRQNENDLADYLAVVKWLESPES